MKRVKVDDESRKEWREASQQSTTGGGKTKVIHLKLTKREKLWLKMLCAHTKMKQQFFVVNALRFFLHVRERFEREYGELRQEKVAIPDNADWLEYRFPYIAHPKETTRTVTVKADSEKEDDKKVTKPQKHYVYETSEGNLRVEPEPVTKKGWTLVDEHTTQELERAVVAVPTDIGEEVANWARLDEQSDTSAHYTAVCLLSQWMQSGGESLGVLDAKLSVDENWDLESYEAPPEDEKGE